MSKCNNCGCETDRLSSVTFIERTCLGRDYSGKWEYQTHQETYCHKCAAAAERGMVKALADVRLIRS